MAKKYSGPILSGSINMGMIGSGGIASGGISFGGMGRNCLQCGNNMDGQPRVEMIGVAYKGSGFGPPQWYCMECCGFSLSKDRFETREDWIRETVPLAKDLPWFALVDWLTEHDRIADAEHIRKKYRS